ncbi:formylglycine-generating enzyme required for sulfatase activity [Litorivivens lipolytica]|uniref:Formylglycine-generating enzyme required for sulfatase activity n=1 Tax=Litorivivens lipolytica TaxID=1524264 RepID=A0A7W4W4X4_9GAMM|nr:PEGA domain-containing protein [Litorivivens lipolytica]MBB3047497.1 formylglycine-generating enzyme required for sulfatase activity [Litorivivens lipolytica]
MKESDSNARNEAIRPAAFQPPDASAAAAPARTVRPLFWVVGALLVVLLAGLWFVLTAKAVKVQTEPAADGISLSGGLAIELGGNYLARPGDYLLRVEKAGYHTLEKPITVSAEGDNLFRFELKKLPGLLTVSSTPEGARFELEGESKGYTPVADIKLEPGSYTYTLSAPRYQPSTGVVDIEGMAREQGLHLALEPGWAEISLRSKPEGALLTVDGVEQGVTGPDGMVVELMPGKHTLKLSLAGYQDWEYSLITEANIAQQLPPVVLQPSYASVELSSRPSGARVQVNGEYQGQTPLTIELRPQSRTELTLNKPGYQTLTKTLSLASGSREQLELTLKPVVGEIEVSATPKDALLYIDGILRGRANQTVQLTATAHKLEIRREGYATHRQTVTPRSGFKQRVNVRLLTEREAFLAQFPKRIRAATGDELVLIEPGGPFAMGSPRREQGRQSNEVQRDVKLTRLFYLATKEVTNEAFRQFRAQHSSGIVQRTTLDNDNYPVARVSWQDAIAFCNWLSRRDGLPEAYRNGQLVTPANTGYRLPTEAEWVWAARYTGGKGERRYAWGNDMPPTGKAGNYADISAQGVVDKTLSTYQDNYIAAAPVGKFDPNPLGLFDLGGNVSEWMNDVYSVEISTAVETDPLGAGAGKLHTIRGSSWRHGRITELRLVYRDSGEEGRDDVGFRLARYAQAQKD